MYGTQKLHFGPNPFDWDGGAGRSHGQVSHKILAAAAYVLVSAIIALWLAYLSSFTETVLTKLNVLPTHLTSAIVTDTVDRRHKVDRLLSAGFDARWDAFAAMPLPVIGENGGRDKIVPAPTGSRRIPVGCEPAFSVTITAGNFSRRCIAAAAAPTRLASAE